MVAVDQIDRLRHLIGRIVNFGKYRRIVLLADITIFAIGYIMSGLMVSDSTLIEFW